MPNSQDGNENNFGEIQTDFSFSESLQPPMRGSCLTHSVMNVLGASYKFSQWLLSDPSGVLTLLRLSNSFYKLPVQLYSLSTYYAVTILDAIVTFFLFLL